MSKSDTKTKTGEMTEETTKALATLSEEHKNALQMDEILHNTIRPGVIRLPVVDVTTAENSDQWAIEVEHPFKGVQRMFYKKPVTWDGTYAIEEVLEWYGIQSNPYQLQLYEVCVEYDKETDEWQLVRPPEYQADWKQRVADTVQSLIPARPIATPMRALVIALTSWALAALMTTFTGDAILSNALGMLWASFVVMALYVGDDDA